MQSTRNSLFYGVRTSECECTVLLLEKLVAQCKSVEGLASSICLSPPYFGMFWLLSRRVDLWVIADDLRGLLCVSVDNSALQCILK